jgi:hypothetical protein
MNDTHDYCVLIIPVDEEPYNAVWTLPRHDSPRFYPALRDHIQAVTGEPLERVNVFADFFGGKDFRYLDMFVNERGHLYEPPLPRNETATRIYQNNVLVHEPGKHRVEELPTIVGPAVLFEEKVWL